MRYEFKKSFDKCVKGLTADSKLEIKEVVFEVIDIVSSGKRPSKGIRLTRLRKDCWEAGTTIKERILFRIADDLIQFILVGNHDDIKRFLKRL
ncbi:hypothetical protein ACFL42_00460 [Candidatus Omnitrophota bacterium]